MSVVHRWLLTVWCVALFVFVLWYRLLCICELFTLYLGANLISSLRATSVPTTPNKIPWDNCRKHINNPFIKPQAEETDTKTWFSIIKKSHLCAIVDTNAVSGDISLSAVVLMMIKTNTYSFFLLAEHRHGYWGHQEQALGLSVEELWYTHTHTQIH